MDETYKELFARIRKEVANMEMGGLLNFVEEDYAEGYRDGFRELYRRIYAIVQTFESNI